MGNESFTQNKNFEYSQLQPNFVGNFSYTKNLNHSL
jgi:hypothetical protein